MNDFTHFNKNGEAFMIDSSGKPATFRTATASGRVLLSRTTFELLQTGGISKGDVISVARLAGIMGAKRTSDLIPLCHPLPISSVEMNFFMNVLDCSVEISAEVKCHGSTGVEMEALCAVSIAALTIYDMCKAAQKDIAIDGIGLIKKTGGKSGDYDINM
ncbi:MAG: cyclic pyranopterin monophosphate synthase MoaC [Clostridiales bacterium]|nr:cyclic pyranopterin monophosphate synthase MoaC [Clostridiales bacterium]